MESLHSQWSLGIIWGIEISTNSWPTENKRCRLYHTLPFKTLSTPLTHFKFRSVDFQSWLTCRSLFATSCFLQYVNDVSSSPFICLLVPRLYGAFIESFNTCLADLMVWSSHLTFMRSGESVFFSCIRCEWHTQCSQCSWDYTRAPVCGMQKAYYIFGISFIFSKVSKAVINLWYDSVCTTAVFGAVPCK